MSTELLHGGQAVNPFAMQQQQGGALAAISGNAETTQALASIWIAKQFPRDLAEVTNRMTQTCGRLSLALASTYAYPRGGQTVEGPSIRLAEALISAWGNAEAGWREVNRKWDPKGFGGKGCNVSECLAFCFDKETNVKREIAFSVPHVRDTRNGGSLLESERDIYELCANMASRRIRACILQVLPSWLTEEALDTCKSTIEKGDKRPMGDILRSLEAKFLEYGVSREMLEKNLGHKLEETTRPELVKLGKTYSSIVDGMVRVGDVFGQSDEPVVKEPNIGNERPKKAYSVKKPEPVAEVVDDQPDYSQGDAEADYTHGDGDFDGIPGLDVPMNDGGADMFGEPVGFDH